jgi:hypothetical protein
VKALLLLAAALGLLAGCATRSASAQSGPSFPLQVSDDRRHLIDQRGRPFFYHADTPWGLVTGFDRAELTRYLDRRAAQGFTALQVQLVPEESITAGTNRFGQWPFLQGWDVTTANPAYFDHAAWVVEQAANRGLLVAMSPIWLGCCQGGRRDIMQTNGAGRCREYGRFLGRRFGGLANLMWIQGGDRDPGPYREVVNAIAEGLRETAPAQLQTAHWSSTHSSMDELRGETWLDVNATYTYSAEHTGAWRRQYHVYHSSKRDLLREPRRPFFLIESTYEGEHGAPAQKIRRQAWWSVLSGSFGHAIGIRPVWGAGPGWQDKLDCPATRDMQHLVRVMMSVEWWTLEPDLEHQVVTAGFGTYNGGDQPGGDDYVTAARTRDRRALIAYVPQGGTLTLDATQFAGPVAGRWIDPTSGAEFPAEPISGTAARVTAPPGNATGARDWVLVVRSAR